MKILSFLSFLIILFSVSCKKETLKPIPPASAGSTDLVNVQFFVEQDCQHDAYSLSLRDSNGNDSIEIFGKVVDPSSPTTPPLLYSTFPEIPVGDSGCSTLGVVLTLHKNYHYMIYSHFQTSMTPYFFKIDSAGTVLWDPVDAVMDSTLNITYDKARVVNSCKKAIVFKYL